MKSLHRWFKSLFKKRVSLEQFSDGYYVVRYDGRLLESTVTKNKDIAEELYNHVVMRAEHGVPHHCFRVIKETNV